MALHVHYQKLNGIHRYKIDGVLSTDTFQLAHAVINRMYV
jgi:hypothetical protein